jgi:2-oxoglutarate dehydrogenase E1 component
MHVEALVRWAIRFIEQYLEFNKEGPQAVSGPTNSPFGANDWLVDELYQQFLEDKQSVDPAWWDFFADYSPADHSPHASATKPAAPVAPAAAAAAAAASSVNMTQIK